MRESVQDIITRLIRFQRSRDAASSAFRKLKHDRDLLPRLQEQLEIILDAYGKFQPVVYDTQGMRDDGSDVVLRLGPEGDKDVELLGFQVKSFDDLENDGYMKILKSQHYDSFNKIKGLSKYFLVLCTDPIVHKKKIRSIEAEFRSANGTEVIEPAFAYSFLFMSRTRIEAIVKRTLEADDYVFQQALNSLDFETPSAKALAVFLSVQFAISGNSHITFPELTEQKALRIIYEELREKQAELIASTLRETDGGLEGDEGERSEGYGPDETEDEEEDDYDDEDIVELEDFEPQLVSDVELLENDILERDASSESYRILTDQLRTTERRRVRCNGSIRVQRRSTLCLYVQCDGSA